ncbi:IS66 family insertion sequence element accessory protein TnpA [Methylobacter sp.]|uniref:IS66 family insertion sequence element accessory protein TnpA n=1 Tax=Methylobacter sp. TaxID=2051955 RepID=UPI003DA24249
MQTIPVKKYSPRYVAEDNAFWQRHITAFSVSGMKRNAYCKMHDVNYDRFCYWIKRLTDGTAKKIKRRVAASLPSVPLLPVQLKPRSVPDEVTPLCTVNFKNGSVLHIHQERALAVLLERWN